MPIFRVGSESGGREAAHATGLVKKALNNVFFFDTKLGPYFKTLEFFILALRVSGPTKDFGGEGPENLTKIRGKNCFAIDLVVPESRWSDASFEELKIYILGGVRECFELCMEKARNSGELLDEAKLRLDFEAGIQFISDASQGNEIFQISKGKEILNEMCEKTERAGNIVDKSQLMKKIQDGIFTV